MPPPRYLVQRFWPYDSMKGPSRVKLWKGLIFPHSFRKELGRFLLIGKSAQKFDWSFGRQDNCHEDFLQ
jgi:hypothetical protein